MLILWRDTKIQSPPDLKSRGIQYRINGPIDVNYPVRIGQESMISGKQDDNESFLIVNVL